jgi:cytochrome c oxidase assembly protein subunit 15
MLILDRPLANLVDNVTAIQFNHRIGAYILAAAIIFYAAAVWRLGSALRARALLLIALLLAQMTVGVATLLHVVPMGLALMHQGLAMVLLLALVWNAAVLRGGRA